MAGPLRVPRAGQAEQDQARSDSAAQPAPGPVASAPSNSCAAEIGNLRLVVELKAHPPHRDPQPALLQSMLFITEQVMISEGMALVTAGTATEHAFH